MLGQLVDKSLVLVDEQAGALRYACTTRSDSTHWSGWTERETLETGGGTPSTIWR
jgi:hypothetical protein